MRLYQIGYNLTAVKLTHCLNDCNGNGRCGSNGMLTVLTLCAGLVEDSYLQSHAPVSDWLQSNSSQAGTLPE